METHTAYQLLLFASYLFFLINEVVPSSFSPFLQGFLGSPASSWVPVGVQKEQFNLGGELEHRNLYVKKKKKLENLGC